MNIEQEVDIIKKELIAAIFSGLENNIISVAQAQRLAADFLAMLPMKDEKDLLTKLKILSDNYEAARKIYLKRISQVNEEKTTHTLETMRQDIAKIMQGGIKK